MGLVVFFQELLWVIVETLFHLLVAAVCVPLAPFAYAVQQCRAARRQKFTSILITGGAHQCVP
jgi:hypothetical protein